METRNLKNGEKPVNNSCWMINPKATTMSPEAICGATARSTSLTSIPTGRPAKTSAGTNRQNVAIV